MSSYLDANILVALHVPEPTSDALTAWLNDSSGPLFVSHLAAGEFGAAISRLVRMERLTAGQAAATLEIFDIWRDAVTHPAPVSDSDIRAAARFVRYPEPKLLMPDAIHLALTDRLGATLVTQDTALVKAATARGIAVLTPV